MHSRHSSVNSPISAPGQMRPFYGSHFARLSRFSKRSRRHASAARHHPHPATRFRRFPFPPSPQPPSPPAASARPGIHCLVHQRADFRKSSTRYFDTPGRINMSGCAVRPAEVMRVSITNRRRQGVAIFFMKRVAKRPRGSSFDGKGERYAKTYSNRIHQRRWHC